LGQLVKKQIEQWAWFIVLTYALLSLGLAICGLVNATSDSPEARALCPEYSRMARIFPAFNFGCWLGERRTTHDR
jgi:hypothetical protein